MTNHRPAVCRPRRIDPRAQRGDGYIIEQKKNKRKSPSPDESHLLEPIFKEIAGTVTFSHHTAEKWLLFMGRITVFLCTYAPLNIAKSCNLSSPRQHFTVRKAPLLPRAGCSSRIKGRSPPPPKSQVEGVLRSFKLIVQLASRGSLGSDLQLESLIRLESELVKGRIQQQYSQNKPQKVLTPKKALRHIYQSLKYTYVKDYSQAIARSTPEKNPEGPELVKNGCQHDRRRQNYRQIGRQLGHQN
ncbi:hypothetical protein TNCV_1244951 [Trichonephila clavipes]|nr:hypothetical protein TNCV_1244951 [Trichonephila clavipes]